MIDLLSANTWVDSRITTALKPSKRSVLQDKYLSIHCLWTHEFINLYVLSHYIDRFEILKSDSFSDKQSHSLVSLLDTVSHNNSPSQIADQGQHCVLNVGVHAIERLNSCDLFPIVFFVKFKSPHDIKQQFKGNCSIEQAQKVFEKAHKLERGYSDRFTGILRLL